MMSRLNLMLLILTLVLPPAAAGNDVRLGELVPSDQVKLGSAAPTLWTNMPGGPSTQANCKLKAGTKGTVVARWGTLSLVTFNEKAWAANCKTEKGVNGQALAWMESDGLQPANDSAQWHGDVCKAYEFLETDGSVPTPPPAEGRSEPCENCGRSPIEDLAQQFDDLGNYHFGNRCLIESPDRTGPSCSFEAMLAAATACTDKNGKAVRCPQKECEKRLSKMACDLSPWRYKSLRERFDLVVAHTEKHCAKYGVDFRAGPCIGTVETGYLEPMAKTLLACENQNQNRYHGLGMITRSTLEDYESPRKRFQVTTGTGKNRKVFKIGPFRTSIPKLNKPSIHACPQKLHDALGASPELQAELMCYALAEKISIAGGRADDLATQRAAYRYYNANPAVDHNGQPHKNNYGDAVDRCVRCLRTRLPDLNKRETIGPVEDPVECLSAATRKEKGHPFWLEPGKRIFSAFDGSIRRYCRGEDD